MEKIVSGKYFLKCITCGRQHNVDPHILTCSECGEYNGTLDVIYPYEEISKKLGKQGLIGGNVFEIFDDIMPFDFPAFIPTVYIGGTKLMKSDALNHYCGTSRTYISDDTRQPSASFKDRATSIAIAMAKQAKMSTMAVASTGNAAASTAVLAAASGMQAILFVPKSAPLPKLTQLYIHGAKVLKFDARYDEIFDLCTQCCKQFGWYNRNTAVNPYTGEGKKTAALEIFLDLGRAPDNLIVPVGDGGIMSGMYKGFWDLNELGLIDSIPRLFGVQAAGCAPLVRAFEDDAQIKPWGKVSTSADSIAVALPRDGIKAMRAVRQTGGRFVDVSDEDIFKAQFDLARLTGIYAEPSAAASFAGFLKLMEGEFIKKNEVSVILITGSGLKDTSFSTKYLNMKEKPLSPDIKSVSKRLGI